MVFNEMHDTALNKAMQHAQLLARERKRLQHALQEIKVTPV